MSLQIFIGLVPHQVIKSVSRSSTSTSPEFSIGQRWISVAELQLGLGMVIEIEHRTVSIIFPATTETRIYAREDAPLSRVRFGVDDWILNQQGDAFKIVDLDESKGLIVYQCVNEAGDEVALPEGKLNNFLQLNRPGERLMNGQIDRNKWFALRYRTRKIANDLLQSPVYGLAGCRTSLIAHQLYIAHEVAQRYAPRVLLADEVGLGKTIEAGLILHQQLLTERANRVLIVVPESLVHQWLVEMLRRFNLMFSVFDAARCDDMHEQDDDSEAELDNPFHSEQLILCSLQFLVDNPVRAQQAVEGEWDLLVVDEAHHLSWSAESVSDEYKTVESLANQTPGVLLLTATPEQLGKESHFARLRLLDPNRFNDLNSFLTEESNYESLADLVDGLQQDSLLDSEQLKLIEKTVGEDENQKWHSLLESEDKEERSAAQQSLVENVLDRHGTGRVLFRNTRHTIKGFPDREVHAYPLKLSAHWQIKYELSNEQSNQPPQQLLSPELGFLADDANFNWASGDARIKWLAGFLQENTDNKVLVITSSASTALGIAEQVRLKTGIKAAVFHEGMSLVERDRGAAFFADHETGTQVLICSEIGSEGRNFQFAHHMVLFDLPVNPDLLEQRIGRLDRIGQNATINIHVPYLQGTAQEVMFRWYHDGLNAFTQTCAAGHQVFMQTRTELLKHLAEPDLPLDNFIEKTNQLYQQLNEALQMGRDRLLEANSCRPLLAEELVDEAIARDYEHDIFSYMERLYDCYGVDSEIRGPDSWVISPGDNMLTKMPGLPDDGMTITYRRNVALANEDVRFLSWEHPFVRNAMDMILSSEFGNTSLVAIKYSTVKPGTILLDCHFLMEFSDDCKLNSQRYFPNSSVHMVVDEQRRDHSAVLSHETIQEISQRVDIDTAVKVVKARQPELNGLLELAEKAASLKVPLLVEAAKKRSQDVLQREIDRLIALQKVNANVRDEEIQFYRDQLSQFENSLGNARLRLDALRVMVSI